MADPVNFSAARDLQRWDFFPDGSVYKPFPINMMALTPRGRLLADAVRDKGHGSEDWSKQDYGWPGHV